MSTIAIFFSFADDLLKVSALKSYDCKDHDDVSENAGKRKFSSASGLGKSCYIILKIAGRY